MISATSQVQKHFQIHSVYKRGRHLYDIQKLNEEEHLQQIYRRKPINTYSIETLDTRLDQSFVNAVEQANKKLSLQINQYKRKYQQDSSSNITLDTKNIYDNQSYLQEGQKSARFKIKGPDLSKMQGRKQTIANKTIYRNQSQFNNYNLSPPKSKAQLNFGLNSPRSKSQLSKVEHFNSQDNKLPIDSLQSSKIHSKNRYDNSTFKCLFEYSKIDRYINTSRKQKTNTKPKLIDEAKRFSAEKFSQVNRSPGLSQFYLSVGKQTPTHLSYRYENQNQRNALYTDLRNTQRDFATKKRKQDMLLKRLNQILEKKKVTDSRNQLCDYKFFNRDCYRKQ